jgi:DNA invertase Pin-like site-specific DNA recombinase
MIYGYARVSTKGQLENNSFEQQTQEILQKFPDATIYREQFTGTTTHRPILDELINKLIQNDMLVVTKLDRLARTTVEGINLVQSFFEKNVSVYVMNIGLLENTTMGDFFIKILLAIAELERNQIIERTQAGKMIAKQDPNFREGRPRIYKDKQIAHALCLLEGKTYKQVEALTGISKSTLIRAKRARNLQRI